MKGNLLKFVAACAVLGATVGFASAQNSWSRAVTHRSSQSDRVRDQKYIQGLKRHHMYRRLDNFQDREGYAHRDRTGGSRSNSDYIRDQKYIQGLKRHHMYGKLDQYQDSEGYSENGQDNRGKHKGWTKGRHNKHHGVGPGQYSG